MLHKTRAIVLHSIRYGDSSLIVHAFTEQWGRQTFMLKGIRKSKKNSQANMFQPLFRLNLDIYYRENKEMQWIRDAAFYDSLPTFGSDVVKLTQAIFMSEVLMKTLREEEKNLNLFSFLFHSISYLESVRPASPSFHLLFLFQLSSYLGFYPRNDFSAGNVFFDVTSATFTSLPPTADIEVEKQLGLGWNRCFTSDYSTIDQVFTSKKIRNLFLDSLLDFYRSHHHSMGELKSLDIIRTIFS